MNVNIKSEIKEASFFIKIKEFIRSLVQNKIILGFALGIVASIVIYYSGSMVLSYINSKTLVEWYYNFSIISFFVFFGLLLFIIKLVGRLSKTKNKINLFTTRIQTYENFVILQNRCVELNNKYSIEDENMDYEFIFSEMLNTIINPDFDFSLVNEDNYLKLNIEKKDIIKLQLLLEKICFIFPKSDIESFQINSVIQYINDAYTAFLINPNNKSNIEKLNEFTKIIINEEIVVAMKKSLNLN